MFWLELFMLALAAPVSIGKPFIDLPVLVNWPFLTKLDDSIDAVPFFI